MNTINADEILRAWSKRGFHGGIWVDPPGQVWRDFVHREDELVMLLEGQLELEVDRREMHPSPGEEILIPAGALHTVRNTGNTTARWLYAYKHS